MKFATKMHNTTHVALGMLLHYLGKEKIQLFGKYLADMDKCKQIAFLLLLTLLFIHKF